MLKKCGLLFLLFSFLLNSKIVAQTDTLFWFAAPELQQAHGDRPIFLRVATGNESAIVSISQPADPTFPVITFFVGANQTFSQDLTTLISRIENGTTNAIARKGLLIRSDKPINCYYDIAGRSNGDMYALKGDNALGTAFTIPFQTDLNTTNRLGGTYTCDIIVVATEDETIITLNPTVPFVGIGTGSFSITLNRGETYVFTASSLTSNGKPMGTVITSNKPIAISTKDDSVDLGACIDTAGDQIIPDRLAGRDFVILKGYFTSSPDFYYILATQNNTFITNSEGASVTINAGQFFSGKLSNESVSVKSDKPVHVFQVSGFGCEIGGAVIPPLKCTGSTQVSLVRATATGEQFYINVLAQSTAINDFTINGSNALIPGSVFRVVPGTNNLWFAARITIPSTSFPSGSPIVIKNTVGKFHVGAIQGGVTSTARYGYFSDFSANTILLRDPNDPNNFIRDEKVFCYNTNAIINAEDPEGELSFTWTGPNGLSLTSAQLLLNNYDNRDTGFYKVTATGAGCGTTTKTIKLRIDKPVAKFSYTTNGCAEDGIDFTADASTGISWKWDFGTGTPVETTDPFVNDLVLNKTGFVPVSVAVASSRGCFSPDSTVLIELTDRPLARFNLPASTCVDSLLILSDASTIVNGNLTKWKWNIADGAGFITKNDNSSVTASFNTWGTKDVQLLVQSQTGCESDTFRIAGGFLVHPLPEPGFILPEICLDDAFAQFIDTTKSPDGFTTFTYQWNFNDGLPPITPAPIPNLSASTAKDPLVQYRAVGRYSVTQTVNARGCIATKTETFKVNGANPVPAFDILTETGLCSNDFVEIVNKSTIDLDDVTRLEIFWDQNDPTLRTVDETPFVGKTYQIKYADFQSPGTKSINIQLVAYSGEALACRKALEQTITLFASPKVTFTDIPGICLEATPRQISEASADPSVPGSFMFSGTGISASGLFDPSLSGAGTYTLKYLFTSDANPACKDSASKDIVVWPRPIADFTLSALQCEKTPVTFTSTSLPLAGVLNEWTWNFGDNNPIQIRTLDEPFDYQYNSFGDYTIDLTVKTDNGCTSIPMTKTITFYPIPLPAFTLPNVCLPEGKALFINNTTIPSSTASLTYQWDFGDPLNNSAGVTKDGLHFYRTTNNFFVKLIATNPATGCKDSLTQLLETVYEQPTAGFISKDSICIGEMIEFTDTSKTNDGIINKWFWNFEGEGGDNLANTSYFYKQPGEKTVIFFAQNDLGCYTDTIRKTIKVFDSPKIDAGPDLFVIDDGSARINAKATGDILAYQWTPSTFLSATDILQPMIVNPTNDIEYRLTVTGRGGCIRSDLVKMKALFAPLPPNTFTPNGDGINDTWVVKNLDLYPDVVIEVYTTSGTLVFRNVGNGIQWDGKHNGKQVPAGTYYYVIDPKNGRKKMAGYVTVLK